MIYHLNYKESNTQIVRFMLSDLTDQEIVQSDKMAGKNWGQSDTIVIDLIDESGYSLAEKILKASPRPKVIAMVFLQRNEKLTELLRLGLTGIIFESDQLTSIIRTFRRILVDHEDLVLSEEYIKSFFRGGRIKEDGLLTSRESQILKMLKMGMTSVEISNELFVSKTTVRTHFKNIYGKLDVNSKSQAIGKALELRLI